jgi:hypothetical protein
MVLQCQAVNLRMACHSTRVPKRGHQADAGKRIIPKGQSRPATAMIKHEHSLQSLWCNLVTDEVDMGIREKAGRRRPDIAALGANLEKHS